MTFPSGKKRVLSGANKAVLCVYVRDKHHHVKCMRRDVPQQHSSHTEMMPARPSSLSGTTTSE